MTDYDILILILRQHFPILPTDINDERYDQVSKLGLQDLISFLRSPNNFINGNIKPNLKQDFFALINRLYDQYKHEAVSTTQSCVCKTILNYFQNEIPAKLKIVNLADTKFSHEYGYSDKTNIHGKVKGTVEVERKYFLKKTSYPVEELFIAWLFRAFIAGSPTVKLKSKEKMGFFKHAKVMSKYKDAKDLYTDDSGIPNSINTENTGLPENLFLTALVKDWDFNNTNIMKTPSGKFIRIDFEKSGQQSHIYKVEKFDLSKMNFRYTMDKCPYVVNDDFSELEKRFAKSEVFRTNTYRAIIKIALYPEKIIRQQFMHAQQLSDSGTEHFDLDLFFSERAKLVEKAMQNEGFKEFMKTVSFDGIFSELAICESGKARARLAPHEYEMMLRFKELGGQVREVPDAIKARSAVAKRAYLNSVMTSWLKLHEVESENFSSKSSTEKQQHILSLLDQGLSWLCYPSEIHHLLGRLKGQNFNFLREENSVTGIFVGAVTWSAIVNRLKERILRLYELHNPSIFTEDEITLAREVLSEDTSRIIDDSKSYLATFEKHMSHRGTPRKIIPYTEYNSVVRTLNLDKDCQLFPSEDYEQNKELLLTKLNRLRFMPTRIRTLLCILKEEQFDFLRQEQGLMKFFGSHGVTATWSSTLNQLKKYIIQRYENYKPEYDSDILMPNQINAAREILSEKSKRIFDDSATSLASLDQLLEKINSTQSAIKNTSSL